MKFFEKIRANTAPPIEVEIENNILAQFFSPFFFKKNLEFNILYFISSGMRLKTKRNWGEHTKKWELLDQALEKNSPELGLMASWSIFEKEAKKQFKFKLNKIGDGRNNSMIEHTSELLKLSNKEIRELKSIVKKRNNIAHNGFTSISWNDVDLVLKVALKLNMK